MKRKIDKSKLEACKLVWKKRIAAEKGISEKCAEKTVQISKTAHSVWNKEPWLDMKKIFTGSSRSLPDRCLWSTGVWSNTRGDDL